MSALRLIKGFDGKPSHPPLTDVAIGGYTIGVLMLILGALDVQNHQMAHGALLAISGGIIFGLLAAVTGLLDWLGLPSGSPVRRLATAHLLIMVTATVLFVLTWLIQRPGYNHATIKTGAWIVGLAAEIVLLAGGYLGGAIVFVYGERVLKQPTTPIAAALIPGRAGGIRSGPRAPTPVPARAQFHARRSGRVRLGLPDRQIVSAPRAARPACPGGPG